MLDVLKIFIGLTIHFTFINCTVLLRPAQMHQIFSSKSSISNFGVSFILNFNFNMAELATLVLLSELVDSYDEKPTRDWVKRRPNKGYFNNMIQELRIEDRFGLREMLRMDISDFESVLANVNDQISPNMTSLKAVHNK